MEFLRVWPAGRWWVDVIAVAAAFCCALSVASAQTAFMENGAAGFVVSDIKYILAGDADKTGACPGGLSKNIADIFASTPAGKRHKGETDEQYAARLNDGAKTLSTAPNGQNLCMNPEAGRPDPFFRTMQAKATSVREAGVDGFNNQFSRVVGCSPSFQSSGLSNGFKTEMLTGAWGIVLTLKNVKGMHNDEDVEVGVFANNDPIQLSPARDPLAYATYAVDQDPRFRAKAKGRIKDGVLTTEPVNMLFHSVTNSMRLERPLLHARLQARISEDGQLEGTLVGYTPVESMYDFQFGYRNGKDATGQLAKLPLRMLTGNGAARVLGYTCPGVYFALNQYADGDQDPQTDRFTSISTQYHLSAIPAFIVDVPTASVNAKLTASTKSDGK